MTTQQKKFFRGDVPISNATVYSVPSSTSAVITSITVVNTTSAPISFSMSMGAVSFISNIEIIANDTVFIELKQVLEEFDAIELEASNTGMKIHVNGVEIS